MGKVYRRIKGGVVLSLAALAVTLCGPARAQVQAVDFTGGSLVTSGGLNTMGWGFSLPASPPASINVTQLGIWDEGGNGLANAHQIGLWRNTGEFITGTTIGAGLSGTAVPGGGGLGVFRYVDISPVFLGPGSYVLGASYVNGDADTMRQIVASLTDADPVSFTQSRFFNNGGFAFPQFTNGTNSFFGPNLRFAGVTASAAPEPGSLALIGMLLGGAHVLRRRKQRK